MLSSRQIQITVLALICAGCERYVVSVNDNEIYTPPPAFIENTFSDASLKRCVIKHFSDLKISSAEQLTRLSCPDAGVRSLDGLQSLSRLRSLDVASNGITSLEPLMAIPTLKNVNLLSNPLLDCAEVKRVAETGVMVTHPEHCIRR